MTSLVKSSELAEKLFVSHALIKTLVKKNNIPYRPDRAGGFILAAEAEEQLVSCMLATAKEKKLSRIRAKAGATGAQTRAEKKLSNDNAEEAKPKRTRTNTTTQSQ